MKIQNQSFHILKGSNYLVLLVFFLPPVVPFYIGLFSEMGISISM